MTLESLLQHHSSKASILRRFFVVRPAVTSVSDYRRTIALTPWTFVSKVTSQLFNTLSRFVIALLPRSKSPLIAWLQSLVAMILEPKKTATVLTLLVTSWCCPFLPRQDFHFVQFFRASFCLLAGTLPDS